MILFAVINEGFTPRKAFINSQLVFVCFKNLIFALATLVTGV